MWFKLLFISFLLYNLSDVEGVKFRYDYSYSHLAEGWLKLHREPATWHDARLQCYLEGAILASPLNNQLRDELIRTVLKQQYSPSLVHTGIHATFSKGTYNSIEAAKISDPGIPLSKLATSWGPGEVDSGKSAENCLAIVAQDANVHFNGDSNGTVIDVACNTSLPYICYKEKTKLEITGCGTSDQGYHPDARTGNCYKFHRNCETWSLAYKTCDAEGGHLAIVNSEVEAQVLKDIFNENPQDDIKRYQNCRSGDEAFIGYLNSGYGDAWMTIHGQSLKSAGFEKWIAGNPSDPERGLHCGSYYREGDFSDNNCEHLLPFICEKNPESLENIDNILENSK